MLLQRRYIVSLFLLTCCTIINHAENFTVRFKGHQEVWTSPRVAYLCHGTIDTVAMTPTGDFEGDYDFWEWHFDCADTLRFCLIQDDYYGDYHQGRLTTLPRVLTSGGTHCLTAGNLDARSNIHRDNSYVYISDEQAYDSLVNDTIGRQSGKLFDIICHDGNHAKYYSSLNGLSGEELLDSIKSLITREKRVTSYQQLREAYSVTDYSTFGTLWDMYSLRRGTYRYPEGASGTASETNADNNREHSLPKSWWGHKNDSCVSAFSDIVHVIPTNGYVNSVRNAYPYGIVTNTTQTLGNGSLKGYGEIEGYSGLVFEPIDEYKGDIARIYFYMLVAYNHLNLGQTVFGSVTFSYEGSRSQFTDYGKELLLSWTRADEVSQKERTRNDGVQSIQGNRNPFVDRPELAEYLWGDMAGEQYYDSEQIITTLNQTHMAARAWRMGDRIVVDCQEPATITLYDICGRMITTTRVNAQKLTISVPQDIVIVRIVTKDNVQSLKIR